MKTPCPSAHLVVWVRPRARREAVGGEHDAVLVVAVRARAVSGAANRALVEALAHAVGVRRTQVVLVRGSRSRRKTVRIDDPPPDLTQRIDRLRAARTR
jgi:hypothetical protein